MKPLEGTRTRPVAEHAPGRRITSAPAKPRAIPSGRQVLDVVPSSGSPRRLCSANTWSRPATPPTRRSRSARRRSDGARPAPPSDERAGILPASSSRRSGGTACRNGEDQGDALVSPARVSRSKWHSRVCVTAPSCTATRRWMTAPSSPTSQAAKPSALMCKPGEVAANTASSSNDGRSPVLPAERGD